MAIVERLQAAEQLERDLNHLRRLVDEGSINEARQLAPALAARWPDSHPIQHLARVLEAPRIIASPPGLRGRSLDREHAWLRDHAHEYPGCWLGVYEDRLIAADADIEVVRQRLRTAVGDDLALLHYQPAAVE